MAFRPLHDRVLIRRVESEEKTVGGIIIPDTAKEKPIEGEVLARRLDSPATKAAYGTNGIMAAKEVRFCADAWLARL